MEIVKNESDHVVYKNHRAEPYFGFLKNGIKTIEGRLNKDLYTQVKVGDHIIVNTNDESDCVEVEVIRVEKYKSFEEMLKNEPINKILPDVENVEEGLKIYRDLYLKEKENEFGVVAIEVKLV